MQGSATTQACQFLESPDLILETPPSADKRVPGDVATFSANNESWQGKSRCPQRGHGIDNSVFVFRLLFYELESLHVFFQPPYAVQNAFQDYWAQCLSGMIVYHHPRTILIEWPGAISPFSSTHPSALSLNNSQERQFRYSKSFR